MICSLQHDDTLYSSLMLPYSPVKEIMISPTWDWDRFAPHSLTDDLSL